MWERPPPLLTQTHHGRWWCASSRHHPPTAAAADPPFVGEMPLVLMQRACTDIQTKIAQPRGEASVCRAECNTNQGAEGQQKAINPLVPRGCPPGVELELERGLSTGPPTAPPCKEPITPSIPTTAGWRIAYGRLPTTGELTPTLSINAAEEDPACVFAAAKPDRVKCGADPETTTISLRTCNADGAALVLASVPSATDALAARVELRVSGFGSLASSIPVRFLLRRKTRLLLSRIRPPEPCWRRRRLRASEHALQRSGQAPPRTPPRTPLADMSLAGVRASGGSQTTALGGAGSCRSMRPLLAVPRECRMTCGKSKAGGG